MTLLHPRLLSSIANRFPRTCTIQQELAEPTRDDHGQIQKDPQNLADHVDIPCRFAPASGSEVRQENQSFVRKLPRILLQGYYPDISELMQAVMDDDGVWNIQQVDHDGEQKITRLSVEQVN